jgi:prepilin-type N-terminal cleavage/methylation domain-containing protein
MRKEASKRTIQKGFSLIELLLVVTIVGILSTIAIPSLLSARDAAEAAETVGTLRTMHTTQIAYHFHNDRYGRLNELNSWAGSSLGTTVGRNLRKGNYEYLGFPSSRNSLKTRYTIISVKFTNGRPISAYIMREDGVIETLFQ